LRKKKNKIEFVYSSINKKRKKMYSLDCSYYTAEFKTLDELIEAATINGMDPNYEITFNGEGTGEQLIDIIQF
jgi:hypothetical protein